MPYIVEINGNKCAWPQRCPLCMNHPIDASISRSYARGTGYFLFFYTYEMTPYQTPVCAKCHKINDRLFFFSVAAMILSFVVFFAVSKGFDAVGFAMPISILIFVLGFIAYMYRAFWLKSFYLAYSRKEVSIFSIKSKDYADEFAAVNGVLASYKRLIIKLF